jgi:membrane protein insertase Oxa1/YidC/SpoIIIJ
MKRFETNELNDNNNDNYTVPQQTNSDDDFSEDELETTYKDIKRVNNFLYSILISLVVLFVSLLILQIIFVIAWYVILLIVDPNSAQEVTQEVMQNLQKVMQNP